MDVDLTDADDTLGLAHAVFVMWVNEEVGLGLQVVSAAGAVDHSQLVQLAEKAFSGLPAEGLSSKEYIDKASPPRQCSH